MRRAGLAWINEMRTTKRVSSWIGVLSAAHAVHCGSHSEPELPGGLEFRSQQFV
jgi:hypothetical protein